MVDYIQKQVLFEEALKKGITTSRIEYIPEILDELIGISDIGSPQYGIPMTPFYKAKDDLQIDVGRIRGYFDGLDRDIRVTDLANAFIEKKLDSITNEFNYRIALLKNRSLAISKQAPIFQQKLNSSATWSFQDSFTSTNSINLDKTTVGIDVSEGIIFLPSDSTTNVIPLNHISIIGNDVQNFNTLDSGPTLAFDGLDSTNYRLLATSTAECSLEVQLNTPTDITSVTIDPIGYGMQVIVSVDFGKGYVQQINRIVYNKITYDINQSSVSKIRIVYFASGSSLPKTIGFKNIVFNTNSFVRTGSFYSKELLPSQPYSEIQLSVKDNVPVGSKLTYYYSDDLQASWKKIIPQTWYSLQDLQSISLSLRPNQAIQSNTFRGVYGIDLGALGGPKASSIKEGKLSVGLGQCEISSFYNDWRDSEDSPKILTPDDFENVPLLKAWSDVPDITSNNSQLSVQQYSDSSVISRNSNYLLFQRKVSPSVFSTDVESKYKHLCFIPFNNSSQPVMRPNYNYRFRYWVYCSKSFSYSDCKYWFLQGFRSPGTRSYQDIGKSYASFSMFINGVTVVGDAQPSTVYATNASSAIFAGLTPTNLSESFSINLNEGWNKIETFINIIDPSLFGEDIFEIGSPYVQLSITPSLFDPTFTEDSDHPITSIIASGEKPPIEEFDLIWNSTQDPTLWAYNSEKTSVLFSSNTNNNIDGFFTGVSPNCRLTYRPINSDITKSLSVRLDLETDRKTTPTVESYQVLTR